MRIYSGKSFQQLVAGASLECAYCSIVFGQGGPVRPGLKCKLCGWKAPGIEGDDITSAIYAAVGISRDLGGPVLGKHCRFCGQGFKRPDQRRTHELKFHREALIRVIDLGLWRSRTPGPTPFAAFMGDAYAGQDRKSFYHSRGAPRSLRQRV